MVPQDTLIMVVVKDRSLTARNSSLKMFSVKLGYEVSVELFSETFPYELDDA